MIMSKFEQLFQFKNIDTQLLILKFESLFLKNSFKTLKYIDIYLIYACQLQKFYIL